jgi:hypothetical protein
MSLKNIIRRLRRTKIKSHLLDGQYKIVEAFTWNGVRYMMFDDTFKVPTGRGLCALTIYEEFNMRCTREYLLSHVRATEVILNSNPVKLTALAQINQNLKERLNLALFPDHVYKLASVIFFDETESPYSYDYKYNNQKIEKWKASGGTLDFFMTTPLKDLIPSLKLPESNAKMFFQVAEQIDSLHQEDLRDIISSKA